MMETNKHEKSGGSAFLWGLIIGALLATLLTNKRGRLILKEIVNLVIELVENFVEERTRKPENVQEIYTEPVEKEEEMANASEDLKSEVAQDETPPIVGDFEPPASEVKSNGNGHHKKRLFRGIRRK